MEAIAVPVRPLPELQCTTITLFGSPFTMLKIFGVLTFEPVVCKFGDPEQKDEGRSVVVRPVEVRHSVAEVLLLVVSGPL